MTIRDEKINAETKSKIIQQRHRTKASGKRPPMKSVQIITVLRRIFITP
jgi:hypothetical protein